MGSFAQAFRLWHTVRHLKTAQLVGRVRHRLSHPKPDHRPAPASRARDGNWVEVAHRRVSMLGPARFRFLNEERDLDAHGWDDPALAKLWRYNLHYFDDLTAVDARARAAWHRALVERWIAENPAAHGSGWEPYPTSLRIVNWIKWIGAGHAPSKEMVASLAVQARWLAGRLEWHLLGNHLFVNAKALVFAGLYFEGAEADAWRETGLRILRAEIPEQILADGGQFERSPMYHALAVEDMLDLVNVMRTFPGVVAKADQRLVEERIAPMRRFLAAMCHPDGEVSFFNDSAIGIAPTTAELDGYAARLAFPSCVPTAEGVTHFPESGYIRVERGRMVAILDVAPIGPDYLPGHAHADTLSMELSIDGARVLVNSGTGEYGTGMERLRQRGTAAHNTVTVDGKDSSEVWSGFRVARRARPRGLQITAGGLQGSQVASDNIEQVTIACSHDGYRWLHGSPVHTRTWTFDPQALTVDDRVAGPGVCLSHWHVTMPITQLTSDAATVGPIRLRCSSGTLQTVSTTFHPEFGLIRYQNKLVVAFVDRSATVRFQW